VGRVIAVMNQKGGVGKTTTAVNLAASLAAAERPTLLVDFDPQANATSSLGVFAGELERPDAYRVLSGEVAIEEALHETALQYLTLLPSTGHLVGAEIELTKVERREHRLRGMLASVRDRFDFVLIDTPPSLGLLTLNALAAADSVLIPLQCEYLALEGLAALMHTIELVRQGLNPALEIEGLLLTMYDVRNTLSRQVVREAREHFGKQVFRAVIPRNVRLSEAPSHGKPALLYDINSKGALSYLELAEELLERTPHGDA
jgi:chromosome partitioning protein